MFWLAGDLSLGSSGFDVLDIELQGAAPHILVYFKAKGDVNQIRHVLQPITLTECDGIKGVITGLQEQFEVRALSSDRSGLTDSNISGCK